MERASFSTPMTPTLVDDEKQPPGDVILPEAQSLGSLRPSRTYPSETQRACLLKSARGASKTSPNDKT
jgi:hypothetical protein